MKTITVLVIEDNTPLRNMVQRSLLRLNFVVHVAANALEGEALATSLQPDIILLDMHLPDKNGWQVATELKANPLTQKIPIIAVTAHAMAGDRERTIHAGCNDYVSKPIDFKLLEEKIRYLANGTQMPGAD